VIQPPESCAYEVLPLGISEVSGINIGQFKKSTGHVEVSAGATVKKKVGKEDRVTTNTLTKQSTISTARKFLLNDSQKNCSPT